MNADILLSVAGVTKRFGDLAVLNGLDLQVSRGEVYGLLGANGAGKTTAINIVTGLLAADAGSVRLGVERADGDRRALIGVAPQDTALYPRLSCVENCAFFARLYGWRGSRLAARVDEVIDLTRLEAYRNTRVSALSGGTRRRLNLAVALVHEPALLILDEPAAGLDVDARSGLWEIIRSLRQSATGVLFTTHLLDEAAALCDRIGVLHEGRIAREGTLQDLCDTIPAEQIAEVESEDHALTDRATALGLMWHQAAGRVRLLLPRVTALEDFARQFSGVPIRSVRLRDVGLGDVYFDVTRGSNVPGL